MSIKLMAAAWELDIPSTEKMVLLCLCDYANDEGGSCYPSIATIAKKTSKNERTIQRALRWLEDNGFVDTRERPGTSAEYALDPRQIVTPDKMSPPSNCHRGGDILSPGGRRGVTQSTIEPPMNLNPPTPRKTGGKVRKDFPDDWKAPSIAALPPQAKACAQEWTKASYAAHAEAFACHWRGRARRNVDWDAIWAQRVVQIHSQVMRDQKSGFAPPSISDGQPVDMAGLKERAALMERRLAGELTPQEYNRLCEETRKAA